MWDGETQDWLGGLAKQEDGKWILRCRFRYYNDDKAFDSKDHKDWYTVGGQVDGQKECDELVDFVNEFISRSKQKGFVNFHEHILLECKPDDPKIFFEMGSRGWVHMGSKVNPRFLMIE
jgi:hypothetical protein